MDNMYCGYFFFKAEDIDLIIEREEEQIKQLMKAYREELTQIEVCTCNRPQTISNDVR